MADIPHQSEGRVGIGVVIIGHTTHLAPDNPVQTRPDHGLAGQHGMAKPAFGLANRLTGSRIAGDCGTQRQTRKNRDERCGRM